MNRHAKALGYRHSNQQEVRDVEDEQQVLIRTYLNRKLDPAEENIPENLVLSHNWLSGLDFHNQTDGLPLEEIALLWFRPGTSRRSRRRTVDRTGSEPDDDDDEEEEEDDDGHSEAAVQRERHIAHELRELERRHRLQIQEIRSELEARDREHQLYRREHADRIDRLSSHSDRLAQRMRAQARKMSEDAQEVERLKKQSNKLTNDLQLQRLEIETLRNENGELKAEHAQLQRNCEQLRETYRALSDKYERLGRLYTKVRQDYNQLQASHSELSSVYKQLQEDYDEVIEQKQGLERQLGDSATERETLERELSNEVTKNKMLEQQCAKAARDARSWKTHAESLQSSKGTHPDLQAEVSKLKKKIEDLEIGLANKAVEEEEHIREIDRLNQEKEIIQSQHKQTINKLKAEQETARSHHDQEATRLRSERNAARSQLETQRTYTKKMQSRKLDDNNTQPPNVYDNLKKGRTISSRSRSGTRRDSNPSYAAQPSRSPSRDSAYASSVTCVEEDVLSRDNDRTSIRSESIESTTSSFYPRSSGSSTRQPPIQRPDDEVDSEVESFVERVRARTGSVTLRLGTMRLTDESKEKSGRGRR